MTRAKQTRRVTPVSCERLRNILEMLPGALFVVDDAETIVYANASAQTLTGTTREEVCGTSLWRGALHLVSTPLYQAVRKTRQTRAPIDVAYVSPATNTWLHVLLSPTDEGLALLFQEQRESLPLQDALSGNEQRYRDLLESVADSVTIVTPDGLVLDINQRLLADAHLRREEVVGTPLTDLPAWSSDPAVQEHLRAAIAQAARGETVRFEARIHPRTDLSLDILMTITAHRDASQQVEYLICAGRDITERKHAEDELRTLVDAVPHFVWIAGPDGSVTYSNQRLIDSLAMTLEQVEGDRWMAGVHPDDQQRVREVWQTSIQTGEPYEVEYRLQDGTSGAYRWFLVRGVPQRDAQGAILHWVGTSTDIDNQKQAEQKIKESEENWRVLAETVPQLVWTRRPDGQFEYTNQRLRDYSGLTLEHIQSDVWAPLQFLHPDDREGNRALLQHALDTGGLFEHEQRLRKSQTGAYRWFLTRGLPVRDEAGQIVKWFGTATDIDEQKRAEQLLKESRENWRVLAEMVPQLVWTAQANGCVDYLNQRACDYGHTTLEQLLGDGWRHFLHPEDAERALAVREHAFHTGVPYEVESRFREGQTGRYRWFLVRAVPVRDETGQIVKWFGTSTDIEDQKRIEETLRQSQERMNILMNSNIIGINVIEGEQMVDANDTFLRMTGYTREDLRAGRLNVMHMTAPEDRARTQQAHQELASQQALTPYEKEYLCQDGSRLPVLVGGVVFPHDPFQAIGFALDNSARKELEQRKDDFISIASHELKTPLTALKLQTQLVQKRLARQSQHEAATALSRVEGPVKQLERLIGELLDVSKIQAGRLEYVWETVDLDALLQEIAETMQHIHPSHTLVVRGAVQTSLLGDRDRLGQVFINLISNAIKYSPDAKTVEMDLSASEETVTVRVHDHGLGIPREQREKIFERFYRASGPKQKTIPGLGMGLYIVAEIIKRHGGTITVDSEVGKGSTFHVALPLKK